MTAISLNAPAALIASIRAAGVSGRVKKFANDNIAFVRLTTEGGCIQASEILTPSGVVRSLSVDPGPRAALAKSIAEAAGFDVQR